MRWQCFGEWWSGEIVYTLVVVRRIRSQKTYRPVRGWLFHALLPLAAYLMLVVAALVANDQGRKALFWVAPRSFTSLSAFTMRGTQSPGTSLPSGRAAGSAVSRLLTLLHLSITEFAKVITDNRQTQRIRQSIAMFDQCLRKKTPELFRSRSKFPI